MIWVEGFVKRLNCDEKVKRETWFKAMMTIVDAKR